jgi:lipopolysaccharide transport system ATP-binding protein
MARPIIEVSGISKHYELGRFGFKTLKDDVRRWLSRSSDDEKIGTNRRFWALRDVSFEVGEGEVLGIVGHNGAGKSTLCKILSRVTEPSAGEAVMRGRTASLLEVGTGFHPDLSGRENIFLNGTILGMKRWEIRRSFDEIVAFSGVEKFLDTPVRRYSSGMQVRLAFAVAAHLEAEILIADEVLAVGDMEFQKKCIGKMKSVASAGRTVLFVSHNLAAVQGLCTRALLIDQGCVAFSGSPEETIRKYVMARNEGSARAEFDPSPNSAVALCAVEVVPEQPDMGTDLPGELPFRIRFRYRVTEPVRGARLDAAMVNGMGQRVCFVRSPDLAGEGQETLMPGEYEAELTVPGDYLAPGEYSVDAILLQPHVRFLDTQRQVVGFRLLHTSPRTEAMGAHVGMVLAEFPWELRPAQA